MCFFHTKLLSFVTRGIWGFILKAGGQHRPYVLQEGALPGGFQINAMLQLCLVQDLRNTVFGIFGNVTSVDVIEVLEFREICEESDPASVKLFGRSTRIIFTQSPESKFSN